jgi:hypothetical protein
MTCVDLPATAKSSEVESDDMTTLFKRSRVLSYSDLRLALPYAGCVTSSETHHSHSPSCHLQRFRPE